MYLIAIAWMYVVLMMAVAEATNANGTVLGAIVTFVLYGVLPLSILLYIMGAPGRGRARKARERAEWEAEQQAQLAAQQAGSEPDASGHAPAAAQADGIAPMGKEG
jgi:hypothetical protein